MKTKLGECKFGLIFQYDKEEWEEWKNNLIKELDAELGKHQISKTARNNEVEFIRNTYTAVLWESSIYMLEQESKPLSLNISHPGKSRRCGWGKYVNLYYAYTHHSHRRKYLATTLQKFLEEVWRDAGQDRLKSLVGSYGGFRFHRHMGHSFWGTNEKNELIVDAPLVKWSDKTRNDFPTNSTPRHARTCIERRKGATLEKSIEPLSDQDLYNYLTDDECPYFDKIPDGEAELFYPSSLITK